MKQVEFKPISEWSFEDKYDKLGEMEKMLHQVRLIRADIGSAVYVLLSIFSLNLALLMRSAMWFTGFKVFGMISITILVYGYYKHSEVRRKLYNRFEHQGAYI